MKFKRIKELLHNLNKSKAYGPMCSIRIFEDESGRVIDSSRFEEGLIFFHSLDDLDQQAVQMGWLPAKHGTIIGKD